MFSPMVMLIRIVEETNYYTTTLDAEKSLSIKKDQLKRDYNAKAQIFSSHYAFYEHEKTTQC